MRVLHLTASTFFGGPERQMLGLAQHLYAPWQTGFASFAEDGRCRAFLAEVRKSGFSATMLQHDTPRLRQAAAELANLLRRSRTDVLCCHGYKANLVGRLAARRLQIPAVAVARGWTGENLRVRLYETVDRVHLRWMDHVVCVSHSQANKVMRAGVPANHVSAIHNAIRVERFAAPQPMRRRQLEQLFFRPPTKIVGAAGRLSPEKGFDVLVEAARTVAAKDANVGFVHFGDGPRRAPLAARAAAVGLSGRFVFAGFRSDLDALLPCFDVLALPSYTEGLPNVVLEACAARLPVVATAVGGTPEVIDHGVNGLLVPPGDAAALAESLAEVLDSATRRQEMGTFGLHKATTQFTFAAQAEQYRLLFDALLSSGPARRPTTELQPC
jgi:glycosyltransferase involved in cell wall biosynthesis